MMPERFIPGASRPVQIAYFVSDIDAAARRVTATFGAGPFHVARRIELHRGRPCRFVHSSAYGQWGDVMLELVQQDVEGPSQFRDMFRPGQGGLHHLAFFVPDLPAAIEAATRAGMPLAAHVTTVGGVEFCSSMPPQPSNTCSSCTSAMRLCSASTASSESRRVVGTARIRCARFEPAGVGGGR